MSNKMRIEIERQVARRAIAALLAAGHEVSVHDGEEFALRRSRDPKAILGAMFSTDEDELISHGAKGVGPGWVKFVYGNDGWDVISDYTTNLEKVLEPVMEWARAETMDFPPDLEMVRELLGKAETPILEQLDKLEESGASVAELRALLTELFVKAMGDNMIEETPRPAGDNALVDCRWFIQCGRKATGTTKHPIMGDVPTCDRCAKFAEERK
jgi:hypothetical protein